MSDQSQAISANIPTLNTGLSARLPLQVGSTAHWSFTRVPPPIVLGIALLAYAAQRASEGWIADTDTLTGVALLSLLALICFGYSIFHLVGAIRTLASDMVIDSTGVSLSTRTKEGSVLRWSDISKPYALVEEGEERQLSVLGALVFVITVFRAGWPLRKVKIWRLFLYVKGEKVLVAKSDRKLEAQSMDAAAQTIISLTQGNRPLEQDPSVKVQTLQCPKCGAPAPAVETATVDCKYCDASIPVNEHVRKQASSAKIVEKSHSVANELARRLIEQPKATPTNRILYLLWLLMLFSWPPVMIIFPASRNSDSVQIPLGLPILSLWLIPPLITLAAWSIGRLHLSKRTAMQLLTLGFGALTPQEAGQPALCRRCHAPLPEAGIRALVRCPYCNSDNITGIDLRPLIDKARAEQQNLAEVLSDQKKAKTIWSTLTLISLCFALPGAFILVVSLTMVFSG